MESDPSENQIIDPVYLPFTPDELRRHFLSDADGQIAYYQRSAKRYRDFLGRHSDRSGIPIQTARNPCQIEKDETFWTATALKRLVDSPRRAEALAALLSQAFGVHPPVSGFDDWAGCLSGRLELVLEATLPSPPSYVEWLRENLPSRNLVPYVQHAAKRSNARTLEGATHVDALVVNVDNGFSLLVEAKVLSDISCVVTFDMFRNQLIRSLDVLLEESEDLVPPLKMRRPDRSVFALLTPQCFREHPHSRLYGLLYARYRTQPTALTCDLPHRVGTDWDRLARRIGWLTFEEIETALPGACPWLSRRPE